MIEIQTTAILCLNEYFRGIDQKGATIGLATTSTMCTTDSASVNQVTLTECIQIYFYYLFVFCFAFRYFVFLPFSLCAVDEKLDGVETVTDYRLSMTSINYWNIIFGAIFVKKRCK